MQKKYWNRKLDVGKLAEEKSFFLFGPRGTGKSFLLRHELQDCYVVHLLDSSLYYKLQAQPSELKSMILASGKNLILIDEIQRIPELLNIVHLMMEEYSLRFILTGSSARKLKRGQANLLAGRAVSRELFPLCSLEIPQFQLNRYLQFGGLPMSYMSTDPTDYLESYVNTYLREEIQAEGLVKKLPAFSQFLHMAATTSGELLNFSSLSNEVGVSANSIREYYSILEDTLVGFMVPAWGKSVRRKPIQTAKFYFFDIGVKNTLSQTLDFSPQSDLWGKAFEHFIAMELRAYISYHLRNRLKLSYWRTTSQFEVDFIVGDRVAIEVKATNRLRQDSAKGLKALQEEDLVEDYYLVSNDPTAKKQDGIHYLPWNQFLEKLWSGKIIKI